MFVINFKIEVVVNNDAKVLFGVDNIFLDNKDDYLVLHVWIEDLNVHQVQDFKVVKVNKNQDLGIKQKVKVFRIDFKERV